MSAFISHRIRLALILVLVLVFALFSLGGAHGQFGPGKNSTGNSPFEHQYRCSKCGAVFTSSQIGGPGSCPSCGVKFVNGGFEPSGPFGPAATRGNGASSGVATFVGILVLGGLFLGFLLFVGLIVLVVVLVNRRPARAAARGPVPLARRRYREDDRSDERRHDRYRDDYDR
jgi:ribosomal protein L37AE/L43A